MKTLTVTIAGVYKYTVTFSVNEKGLFKSGHVGNRNIHHSSDVAAEINKVLKMQEARGKKL